MTDRIPMPLAAEPLSTYAYAYPHKSSYGPLTPAVAIADAWRDEDAKDLSLYVHIPFCEMRCGFCNLFTQSQPPPALIEAYLATLIRQMHRIRSAVPHATFAQAAVGGGTPTILTPAQLETLFDSLESIFGLSIRSVPTSVETSPATATPDRLAALAAVGVERVSIGVQSFIQDEARGLGRPQRIAAVHRALEAIRRCPFPVLNIDLIYGDPTQSIPGWETSLHEALRYEPEEIYLYPLYVRPGTGLGRTGRTPLERRNEFYRYGRDLLLDQGYIQQSLRCFALPSLGRQPAYACQRDGMIGLGCGARSYTSELHYSTRFAVDQQAVSRIVAGWVEESDERLGTACYGIRLSPEEQRRRYLILSLLRSEGMPVSEYRSRFQTDAWDEFPALMWLESHGWLTRSPDRLVLTADGIEHSDEVGPLLYSSAVRDRLREFVRR